ncbi:S8 family serine peptidase [Schaalia sp. HMT-877]|nr:S8 family serine peptidase [Schaalia sp. HMT-877]
MARTRTSAPRLRAALARARTRAPRRPARALALVVRAVGRAGPALALAASLALAGAPGAAAVDEITTQEYVGPLGVDKEAAAGYTGEGVTIAVIDGPADTTVPELAGADITVKPMCDFTATLDSRTHGTTVVSLLAARGYGVARGARITNYSIPSSDDTDKSSCTGTSIDDAISAAVADGARVISISLGGGKLAERAREAVAGAVARGVVVVVGTGNDGAQDPSDSLASVNGTVGVGASDTAGRIQSYSNYGRGLAVMAPGDRITEHDFATGQTIVSSGTSYATPIVAGFVAVAMQRWPQASGNQIVQTLVATATTGPTGQPLISPHGLDTTDPTQYPDTNPLLDKFPGTQPTAQTVADYADGLLATESVFANDPAYTYRGTDPTIITTHPDRTALGTSPRYHKPGQ